MVDVSVELDADYELAILIPFFFSNILIIFFFVTSSKCEL
jgi:hypothetical protein